MDSNQKIYGLIYRATNIITNKVYIGKHKGTSVTKRWKRHLYDARKGMKSYLCNSIRKHGDGPWVIDLIEYIYISDDKNTNRESLSLAEQRWISHFKSNNRNYGYNSTSGGDGGFEFSKETRSKISKAHRGKHLSKEHIENIRKRLYGNQYAKGYRHTEETKQKVSEGLRKYRKFSDEEELKICKRYCAGETCAIIAKDMCCTKTTIDDIKNRRRVKSRPKGAKKRLFSDEEELEICNIYESGEGDNVLAKRYNCSNVTIANIRKKYGIDTRSISKINEARRLFSNEEELKICYRYQNGYSDQEIADNYGCSLITIQKTRKRHGIKSRTLSEAQLLRRRRLA